MTVVLITHYMEEAVEADRVIVIDSGKIEMDAAPIEVFPNVEKMKALGLDTPQATELAFLLGKSGFNIDSNVLTVSECADKIANHFRNNEVVSIHSSEPTLETVFISLTGRKLI